MSNQDSPATPDPLRAAATSLSEASPQENSAPPLPSSDKAKTWNSEELLGAETEAFIVHRGQTYRLRCTKQGKLILYK